VTGSENHVPDFSDCVALVTGGGAGIGRATAAELAARGASVSILDIDPSGAPEGVRGIVADLRDSDSVNRAVRSVAESAGRLDVLVNNAGVSHVGGIEDGDLDEWHALLDINLLGYVRATRAALPYLRRSPHAAIVNVASCSAASGIPRRALYSASKGAIASMTLSLAADLISEGIRVNAVNPGTVDTPFMDDLAARTDDPTAARAAFHARQPTGHMVDPSEVAAAIAYLAHPSNRSAVGSVLTIDGGLERLRTTPAATPVEEPSR
jgi:2-keto-3-deoxy-L-fuconate dehydrogenase